MAERDLKRLYLIGGAARSGKSLLAARLLRRHGLPYFPIDYLTSGLQAGAPETGVRHDSTSRIRGARIWPVLEGLLRNVAEEEPGYVVEGDVLLPDRVASLCSEYGESVRACFLGYAASTVESRKQAMRANPGPINDWIAGLDDAALGALAEEMIEWSAFLKAECERYGLRYVDTGADFHAALAAAEACLVG